MVVAKLGEFAHDALAMIHYAQEKPVLIVADSDAAARRATELVTSHGGRPAGVAPVAEGLARLDRQAAVAAVLLDIREDAGEPLDRLLDRLDADAAAGRLAAIISTPPELIDPVAARLRRPAAMHLCNPDAADWDRAMESALAPAEVRVNELDRPGSPRLQQLSEEVGRIANLLAELSEEENAQAGADFAKPISPRAIRSIIRARRLRERFFGKDLFADPAWDMMLDLMAARLEGRQVAVSSLCIAAAVPPTTALRWIKTLTENGFFARTADPQDGRRVHVDLSESAAAAFEGYLRTISGMRATVI